MIEKDNSSYAVAQRLGHLEELVQIIGTNIDVLNTTINNILFVTKSLQERVAILEKQAPAPKLKRTAANE